MTNPNSPAGTRQAAVDAALVVLRSMGLSLDDLTAAPCDRPAVPTLADYVPVVSASVTDGTRKAYAGHTDGTGDTGTATSTCVRATLTEVATALAALTSEPHPLAEPEGRPA
jgi:hypothetical protein